MTNTVVSSVSWIPLEFTGPEVEDYHLIPEILLIQEVGDRLHGSHRSRHCCHEDITRYAGIETDPSTIGFNIDYDRRYVSEQCLELTKNGLLERVDEAKAKY